MLRGFENKKQVFEYVKNRFSKQGSLVLMRGSSANKPVRKFSDFKNML